MTFAKSRESNQKAFSELEGGINKTREPKAYDFDKAEDMNIENGDWKKLTQRQTRKSLYPRATV